MTPTAPAKDTNRYFEEISVGETFSREDVRPITEADLVNFAGVIEDFYKAHVSRAYVRDHPTFEGRVAHRNLVHSITEALVTDRNPLAFSYEHDNLRFVRPIYIGDTTSVSREVLHSALHVSVSG
jgi:acyl dehydratase